MPGWVPHVFQTDWYFADVVLVESQNVGNVVQYYERLTPEIRDWWWAKSIV